QLLLLAQTIAARAGRDHEPNLQRSLVLPWKKRTRAYIGLTSSAMANLFRKTSCRSCLRKPTNSRRFLRVAASPQRIHQTSNIEHLTSRHEYRICWSGPDGREHGAPFEGPWFSRYCGLRHESQGCDRARIGAWLRRRTAFVGSYRRVRRDLHRGD